MTRNVKLVLAYDGTDFSGWQRQSNDRSAQEALETALAKMHGHPVAVVAAGRTDSGVHAAGQVASFRSDIASIPADRWRLALNKLLPPDLRVLESSDADPDFHARYDARLRRYRYFVVCGPSCPPHRSRFAWWVRKRPDVRTLNGMAAAILGETDFTAFSSAKDVSSNRHRFVHSASWRWEGDSLVFEVAANAFLWRMVRSLVGSMIEYEAEGRDGSWMRDVLRSGDRALAGATAPACGLFLWNVEYYAEPTRRGRAPSANGDSVGADADDADGDADGNPDAGDGNASPRLVPGYGYVEA